MNSGIYKGSLYRCNFPSSKAHKSLGPLPCFAVCNKLKKVERWSQSCLFSGILSHPSVSSGDYSKAPHGYQDAQVLIPQELFIRSPLYMASQIPSPWSVAYNHKYTANMLQRIFIPSSLENNHKIEVCPWSAQTQLHSDCFYFCLCVCATANVWRSKTVVGGSFLY